MLNRKAAVSGVGIVAVALAGGCADNPPTEPHLEQSEVAGLFGRAPAATTGFEGTLDAQFVRIAQQVPGFGGFYYDEAGTLNVVMAPADAPLSLGAVRAGLAPFLATIGQDPAAAQGAVIQAGQYDFVQLDAMHRQVMPVLGLAGAVFTDADEVRNRVVIGVEDAAAEAAVARAVAMLDLPSAAVIIERSPPIVTESEHTLRDFQRPIGGGLQIHFDRFGSTFICTLGFLVRAPGRPNVQGMVNNSHCSAERSVVHDTPYWQHSRFVPNTMIGVEVHDIPPTTGGNCPAGRVCRWSDALGAEFDAGVDQAFGAIYRTESFGEGLNPGSIVIDPANPRWQVVDEIPFPVVGQVVHKTGRTNGWTRGPVNNSCQTVNVGGSNFTMFCQDRVTTWSGGGDSGSPYFERIGETNDVRLIGIHWGSDGAGNTVMSAMNNIRCENEGPVGWITFPGQTPPATPPCDR